MKKTYRALANQIDAVLHMSVSMQAQDQMLEIVFKDSPLMIPADIPVDTVTTKYHDDLMADAAAEYTKLVRVSKATIEDLMGKITMAEGSLEIARKGARSWQSKWVKADAEIKELTALLDERTKPKATEPYDSDATELEKLGDAIHQAQKTKEIKHILQDAMVKGLVQTPEEKEQADADFDRVRMTKFYTDKELQTIDKMPKFSGHSLIKGKWIYIKQPPLTQLAADETPFLNLRPKRPARGSLNKNEVWQLRRYIKSGRRNNWIMERMGLSSAAVSQCKTGKTYSKVPPEPVLKNKPTTVHAGEGVIEQKSGAK